LNDIVTARRVYRLWRNSALLCFIGTGEVVLLAWQRDLPWLAFAGVPLVALAVFATRRAARIRRSWQQGA
jgi:hypothetical protein